MNVTTIRHRVVAAAHHAGLRIADLARRVGVQPPTIHGGLSTNSPAFKHLPRIAEICGVSIDWLRNGDHAQEPLWWASYGQPSNPGTPAPMVDERSPAHLLERIRVLENEKVSTLRERDDARAQVDSLEQEVEDLTLTVAHQAVRLAKLHKASDSTPEVMAR
jgi:lambda repressor-like predicted transcriptional regulator